MRYKQDLAEFIPIADGARLIQGRAGLSEDESREDIVLAVRERALDSRWYCTSRGERRERFTGDLPHGFVDSLTPDLIDWERSIARRRGLGAQFTVEIEVSRTDVCRLALALDGAEDRNDDRPALKQDEGRPPDKQPSSGGRPTLKIEIEAAYKEVRDAGYINYDAPIIRLYDQIRKKVREYKGDPNLEKGLQKEAIRKVISSLFEEDKNRRFTSP